MFDRVFFKWAVLIVFIQWGVITVCSATSQSPASVRPHDLTCEYLINPTGLDVVAPRFSWTLKATSPDAHGQRQTAYRIWVSRAKDALEAGVGDMWDSDWVTSDKMFLIEYEGNPLTSDRTYYWRVAVKDEHGIVSAFSKTAQWSTGLFSQEEWTARWIGTGDAYNPQEGPNIMPDPWFRKTLRLEVKPVRATLFVASVGYHEVYVNGQRLGDHVLAPAVSDHTQRARYLAYDIAPALNEGENTVVLWLGTSWSIFAPYATSDKPRAPIVIAQADIYGDGTEKLGKLVTDESWETHPSPNHLLGNWGFGVGGYGGELWDAQFTEGAWKPVAMYEPSLMLSAQKVEANVLTDEIRPIGVESRPDGSYRIDMGVNYAGWSHIPVEGNPGDTVRFLFSERDDEEMTFSLSSAYILGSSGKGVFQHRFNYGSGRWITVKGSSRIPSKDEIKGWVVRTDFKDAGHFESSDSLQNWIYETVKWTFENLSLGGFIVDCPQRERFGYGGDAHATSETGLLNYKLGAFYTKWLEDWRDVQGTEPMVGNMNDPQWARKQVGSGRYQGGGVLPQTAPTYHGGGGPAWGGIVVTLPWFLYEYMGDTRVLEENFDMINQWLAFLDTHVEDDLLKRYGGPWDFLGDWLWPGATAQGMNNDSDETIFFNNCYRVYNLRTASAIARVIGKDMYADKWQEQAERSSAAIHRRYYRADDYNYSDGTMRSLTAALYGNVMPVELRGKVMDRLEKEILVYQNGHIDVGITGGAMLFKVLREAGRNDLIYTMTSKTTYPGWGLMRESGATTMWEMWEKDLPGHSLLHSSFLYPGAWYMDGVLGINKKEPGFRSVEIRIPRANELSIEWARGSFDSPSGKIRSAWGYQGEERVVEVTVPPNCQATVYIPVEGDEKIVESSGQAIFKRVDRGYMVFDIPAGSYRFTN